MTEERLKRMFDEAEPDEATLDRMWAVIDAAYDEMAAEEAGGAAGEGEGAAQAAEPQPQPQWRVRRGGKRWIPAVAAVLVVAVGIGIVLGSGAAKKSEPALAPDGARPTVSEAAGTAPEKSYDMDAYEMSNMPAPEPSFAPDAAGEAAEADGGITFLTGEDGRRYSARTLMVAVQDCDVDALCAKYGVSLKYDWDQWVVVELDHDATVEELAQLAAALEAEPGVLEVEYDWETTAF